MDVHTHHLLFGEAPVITSYDTMVPLIDLHDRDVLVHVKTLQGLGRQEPCEKLPNPYSFTPPTPKTRDLSLPKNCNILPLEPLVRVVKSVLVLVSHRANQEFHKLRHFLYSDSQVP